LNILLRAAVTDDLISPKYDDDVINDESTDDGDDEDDESDDTVYECPGKFTPSSGGLYYNDRNSFISHGLT